jgi:hypothetical protein
MIHLLSPGGSDGGGIEVERLATVGNVASGATPGDAARAEASGGLSSSAITEVIESC